MILVNNGFTNSLYFSVFISGLFYVSVKLRLAMAVMACIKLCVVPSGDASQAKLPGSGGREAEHSCHLAETDLFLKPLEAILPGSNLP